MKVPFLVPLSVVVAFCFPWLCAGCTPRSEIKAPVEAKPPIGAVVAPSTAVEPPTESTATPEKESESAKAVGKAKPASSEAENRTGTAPPPRGPSEPLSPECRALVAEITKLDKQIPWYYHVNKRSAADIHADIVTCAGLCESFLSKCPQSALVCEVTATLARVLFGGQEWHKSEIEREYGEKLSGPSTASAAWKKWNAYKNRVLALAEEVISGCTPPGSRARRTALWVTFESRVAAGLYAKAREAGKTLIDELPFATDSGQEVEDIKSGVHMSMAYTFQYEGNYEAVVEYLRAVIDKHHTDPEYGLYNDILLQGLTGTGDLEGMRELQYQVRAEYPERLPGLPEGYLIRQYEHALYITQFWLGFVSMVLGEMDDAAELFQSNILEINEFHERRKAEGQLPLTYLEVYRDQRSGTLLRFIRELYGRVPEITQEDGTRGPLDFDLGDLWATEKRLSLKESRGKVVAVLFRRPTNASAASFIQQLDPFIGERAKDGLAAITLGFVRRKPHAGQDSARCKRMRDELATLKVKNFVGGFDPDRTGHKIFRGLGGTVGTPSFVVLDRQGKIAWFLADPRALHVKLAERVIDRLLKEKA
jgi:tetratricopeptide (TPR) repeat protein